MAPTGSMFAMSAPRLNNLTVYVSEDDFEAVATFYRTLFPQVLFEGEDIICFEAGPGARAVCPRRRRAGPVSR